MRIPYRHRRILNRIAMVLLILLLILIVAWVCCVVWLQRYVVYTRDGVYLDFNQSAYEVSGQEVSPPQAAQNISIYYNEGADAIKTTTEMEQIAGYYITTEMFQTDYDNVMLQVERLPAGTAVMIDMKGDYGSFYYESKLPEAIQSASTDIPKVAKLVQRLHDKGFYTIAKISAFRDYNFGLNNVSSGLFMLSRAGLWQDNGGMYWLDPTNATTTNWISSVVLELKSLGFDEVALYNFCFPVSDQYIFNGDKPAALAQAAETLLKAVTSEDFVLSFLVEDATFTLPEGRCRMYLEGINANSISQTVAQVTFEDKEIRLLFLSDSGDTRYDDYCVLRNIGISEEVEARNIG